MYKKHFNLTRSPFDLTPNPASFVPIKGHNDALTAIYHGVRQHKGFVVVVGEVGTGKTLLVRCLLGLLGKSKDIAYSYVVNGRLPEVEFLQYVLTDLGLSVAGKSKYELLLDFGHYLADRNARRMTTILIVDEAHLLSAEILEEIRLLSNLESNEDKLLQIVLVGQPELNEKLDSAQFRQLKQRIAVRAQLTGLTLIESRQYILQRLKQAGCPNGDTRLFPSETISAIHQVTHGLPRLINLVCENALIEAYGIRAEFVTREIVQSVARQYRLDVEPANRESGYPVTNLDPDLQYLLKILLDGYRNGRRAASGEPFAAIQEPER